MNNEKKLWLCEQYAHKAWTLSLALAQEAARAGTHGKGFVVVASEARILAENLFEYCANKRFNGGDADFSSIAGFALMLKFLATNSAIETYRVAETSMEFNVPKSMSVFAEEMRRLAVDINELAGNTRWDKPFTIPEMAKPSGSNASGQFFKYTISGFSLLENLKNVVEIMYCRRIDIEGKKTNQRGHEFPVINCYKHFNIPYENSGSEYQTVLIVSPDGNPFGDKYAIPIDELDVSAIFYSHFGTSVPVKLENVFAEYTRECWDAVGGGQFVFVDWIKLLSVV